MKKYFQEVKGGKLAETDSVAIYSGFPQNYYELKQPDFSEKEKQLVQYFVGAIDGRLSVQEFSGLGLKEKPAEKLADDFNKKILQEIAFSSALLRLPDTEVIAGLRASLEAMVKDSFPDAKNALTIVNDVLDSTVGLGRLSRLLEDAELEEIMVNGLSKPVFVFHRRFGMCKTNLSIDRPQLLERIAKRIANTVERKFDANNPLLDARLPDGSRVNAVAPQLAMAGASITIRKFTHVPMSIVDIISNKTISSELAAFLWAMVEGLNIEPMSLIIIGGSGTGKTTMLNALTTFVRFNERVVCIEDTVELDLGSRQNFVQMESRPKTRLVEEVSMDDLLRNALRMRPDRIIIGEVRGEEAQTLFAAMDTGHSGCMGTLHANSAREMLLRLKSPPMNVPEPMLPLLDLVVVQSKISMPGKSPIRRITQIAEIYRMEEKVLLGNIFEWNRQTDAIARTDTPSHLLESLAERTGISKNDLKREMLLRQRILEWMLKNNIRENSEVEQIVQSYYSNPDVLLEEVSKNL